MTNSAKLNLPLKLTAPIVGAQFRPPAALLLRILPSQHPLYIEPEPSNEHDPDALRVMLDLSTLDLDNEQIANILTQTDLTTQTAIEDFANHNALQLGYVARSSNTRSCQIDNRPSIGNTQILAALVHRKIAKPLNLHWKHPCHLTFSMSGQPLIEIQIP